MKLTSFFNLAFITLMICISSCMKKESGPPEPPESLQLTPKTMTGEETLSFLKDGKVWVADQDGFSPVSILSSGSKKIAIDSRRKWDVNQKEIFTLGFHLLDYTNRTYYDYQGNFSGRFYPEYDLGIYCLTQGGYEVLSISPEDTFNYVNITYLDFSGNFNIIAGTFQLRMINVENEECQDTIYITEGRFDLEFDVIP